MNAHLERAVPNSIEGHLLQLGEGHKIAIYTRHGMFWVAEFKSERVELFNAGTFFRFHAAPLRYSKRLCALASESDTALTAQVLESIEQLHQQREARDTKMLGAAMALVANVMRCGRGLALTFGTLGRKSWNDSVDGRRPRGQPLAEWSHHD